MTVKSNQEKTAPPLATWNTSNTGEQRGGTETETVSVANAHMPRGNTKTQTTGLSTKAAVYEDEQGYGTGGTATATPRASTSGLSTKRGLA